MDARHIIKRPIITEKSNLSKEFAGHHVFEVSKDANKIEIRKAIEELFGVTVVDVQTCVMRGKNKRRGRQVGRQPNWKKAMVKLAAGESIDFFEGV
ncbi:MAG: 50S ribosomal protein L23 [Deltaproteobacteria bacterium]|nr:50S ribosomal protein L23 [Deltaproteobacteria bacterium]MCB9479022.1 50S ribosomal protein L23 [Deltaproteobacteria bacterium]MCB9487770.1 50S ribosomal protein L23 [Deltaproteobacteria bacterium]